MSMLQSSYSQCIEASERVTWKLDEVFPRSTHLDLQRAFLPNTMFDAGSLAFLNEDERRTLNQISGNGYCYFFYFVETYIITLAMKHAEAELYGDETNLRALLRFAEEEVKHQQMFSRFGEVFEREFGSRCDLVESPQTAAAVILGKSPMGVLLITLHIELLTQAHYVGCMRDVDSIEPLFKNLFKYHWLEEAQHAKLDALELKKLHAYASPAQIQTAIDDYFDILDALDDVFSRQAALDVITIERALSRSFSVQEQKAIEAIQHKTYRRIFIKDGLTHTVFLEFLGEYFRAALERASKRAAELS